MATWQWRVVGLDLKTSSPFGGKPVDKIGLLINGDTHLFGGAGSRLASTRAALQ